ncbi:hypothetical protein B0H63DRAFT_399750 [Podospora didyma]|uniref:Uncharacterized protein n=1 Tax=Podospora didyma TaxID=330526 RepID=A0AAE0KDE9_9PEZI|nr:hypothetical protein B0H63DRAFT_399750 [Podospora didyma]
MLMHLIGNPINTIASLLATIHGCQGWVNLLRKRMERLAQNNPKYSPRTRRRAGTLWKPFALLCVSYEEWGVRNWEAFLLNSLDQLLLTPNPEVMEHFEEAASLLAADRSTYALPIFSAQFAFIFAIGAAYWRVIGVKPQPHSWTNVEAYSIAMSAPFLYTVPAVFLSAVVGVAQTETSIPQILNSLRDKLINDGWDAILAERYKEGNNMVDVIPLPANNARHEDDDGAVVEESPEAPATLFQRITSGGLYSWRPGMLATGNLHETWPHIALATSFVVFSVFVAGWISYRVPPEGFDCRNAAQMSLLGVWLLNFSLDFFLTLAMDKLYHLLHAGAGGRRKSWYWYEIMFAKDLIMALAAFTLIMVTQLGIFNRCDCYTLWGTVPLALPQIREVAAVLMDRISFEWPLVTFLWIGIELVLCVAIWGRYSEAFRVYMQKDDRTSNLDWAPGWVRRLFKGKGGGGVEVEMEVIQGFPGGVRRGGGTTRGGGC